MSNTNKTMNNKKPTKNEFIERCYMCEEKKEVADRFTRYGCSSYDPPEPREEKYVCVDCYPEFEKKWEERFRNGYKGGDWRKSKAEKKMAKKYGYEWCSKGVGVLGSEEKFESRHQYITKERYNELKRLPYWGYCKICGSVKSGGHCSRKECENSFNLKNNDQQ